MKLLYREDVQEAGYDLPAEGLCSNIGQEEMEALKFGGEWVLAADEVLVSDGHEQRFLYMVVSGQVGIYKADEQGRSQMIASLGQGAAFGEMAFLSGGVASASVQAVGECVLWRMDHERLLQFIGEHGFAGGQLCLNVASILSGRLVDGNRKVLDMGRELQESLQHLQSASAADQQKSEALKQMQGKVANMQNAFKGSAVKKSGFSPLTAVAFGLAGISLAGMVGLFLSIDDSIQERADSLAGKVEKLEKNETFYLDLKKRLEGENAEMAEQTKSLLLEKQNLENKVAKAEGDLDDLKSEVRSLERDLGEAKDDLVRARRVQQPEPSASDSDQPNVSDAFVDSVLGWAKRYSTVAFPVEVIVKSELVTLTDRARQAQVPVRPGEKIRAKGFHPQAPNLLIVAQLNSDMLLATLAIDNSNLIEALAPKFTRHMNSMGQSVKNPFAKKKPLNEEPPPVSRASSPAKPSNPSDSTAELVSGAEKVLKGTPTQEQKAEDFLKATSGEALGKSKANDHGTSCVCKDCRASKVGKGSLFPE